MEQIQKRLEIAEKELTCKDHYDYQIVNDNLENAVGELEQILAKHWG